MLGCQSWVWKSGSEECYLKDRVDFGVKLIDCEDCVAYSPAGRYSTIKKVTTVVKETIGEGEETEERPLVSPTKEGDKPTRVEREKAPDAERSPGTGGGVRRIPEPSEEIITEATKSPSPSPVPSPPPRPEPSPVPSPMPHPSPHPHPSPMRSPPSPTPLPQASPPSPPSPTPLPQASPPSLPSPTPYPHPSPPSLPPPSVVQVIT